MNTDEDSLMRKLSAYCLSLMMNTELSPELTEATKLQLYAFE